MTEPHVAALYRYPVKGMTPEAVERLRVAVGGAVEGDRVLGFLLADAGEPPRGEWWPKAAFVVLTNSWSAGAASQIAGKLAATFLPAPAAPASTTDAEAAAKARLVFDELRGGTLDRSLLTEDANYYFTPTAIADYKASLAPLDDPQSFTQTGRTNLRGGFVLRGYTIKYADRTLRLSTFFDPATGKIEQFLVTPSGQ